MIKLYKSQWIHDAVGTGDIMDQTEIDMYIKSLRQSHKTLDNSNI